MTNTKENCILRKKLFRFPFHWESKILFSNLLKGLVWKMSPCPRIKSDLYPATTPQYDASKTKIAYYIYYLFAARCSGSSRTAAAGCPCPGKARTCNRVSGSRRRCGSRRCRCPACPSACRRRLERRHRHAVRCRRRGRRALAPRPRTAWRRVIYFERSRARAHTHARFTCPHECTAGGFLLLYFSVLPQVTRDHNRAPKKYRGGDEKRRRRRRGRYTSGDVNSEIRREKVVARGRVYVVWHFRGIKLDCGRRHLEVR